MFFQKLLFKSSLLLNGYCVIVVRSQNSSDDLCFLFCLMLLIWLTCLASRIPACVEQINLLLLICHGLVTVATLLDNLTDDAIAQLYATTFSTMHFPLYLTKLYVT